MKLLSIIVPVYNEEANIEPLYEAVNQALQPIVDQYRWEFVFTDNCSTDQTYERLQRLAARDTRVRVYRFTRNFGFQRSILTGYRLAQGEAAIQIDCDLQDPPDLILEFVKLWEQGFKVVYGVRRSRPDPIMLILARRLFYRIIARISQNELPVDAGDFRLVDRCVLDLLHSYSDENPYLRGYIASLGYRQVGISYDRAKRERGKTSFSLRSLINLAVDGVVSNSILPLRLASFIGIFLSILSVFAIIVYLILWLAYEQSWPAGFATLAFLVLSSLAVNSIFLGIIGEYLARVYNQVKPQPLTIVERFVDHAAGEQSADRSITRAVAGVILPLEQPKDQNGSKAHNDAI